MLLDQFPATSAGHVSFLEFVRDRVNRATYLKDHDPKGEFSDHTLSEIVPAEIWEEAKRRISALASDVPDAAVEKVSRILQWQLTAGSVQSVDSRPRPAVDALREAFQNAASQSVATARALSGIAHELRQPKKRRCYDRDHLWQRLEIVGIVNIQREK